MEIPVIGEDWKTLSSVCRCCLIGGCCEDISSVHFSSGTEEIYQDMLKETFDIELSHQDELTLSLICEGCIVKLRQALAFKQLVLKSEQYIREYLDSLKRRFDKATTAECAINASTSPVKQEEVEHTYEDETLLHIEDNPQYEQHGNDGEKQRKDWRKIAERRGNGPILRENSLKLIQNSTLCVFQWNKSRYRCFCCKEPFSDMATLREHTNTHTIQAIEKKIILQQNRLVKVEITDLKCKLCSLSINNLVDLKDHLVTHGLEFLNNDDLLVPFKLGAELNCQLCSKQFTVFRLLNIHMNKHYQKQVCHICGAGFSNLVFLNLHKTRSHRPLKCKECDVEFASKKDKSEHERSKHNIKTVRKLRFPCQYCPERFVQENLKIKHLVERHNMIKPEHKCTQCDKTFITKSLRNNHVKNVHQKERKRECDICHNRFYTQSDVARHRVTHTGEKNYECSVCSNLFSTRDSLRRHVRRTHGTD